MNKRIGDNNKLLLLGWIFILLYLMFLAPACERKKTKLEGIISSLPGGFVFVVNEKTRLLKKYDFKTGQSSVLASTIKMAEYPQSIAEGKQIFCSSDDGIYMLNRSEFERIFSVKVVKFCPLSDNKIAYIKKNSQGSYSLIVTKLHEDKLVEVLQELVDFSTHLTSFKNTIFFDSNHGNFYARENYIYNIEVSEVGKASIKFITRGRHPVICSNGKKLAYLSNDSELTILNMRSGSIKRTGIKRVVDLTWIKDTNYLICKQWKSNFHTDWTALEIVDSITGEIFVLEGLRSSGPGLAWVDF